MNCQEIKDLLLTDHLDGEQGPEESAAVQRHLAECSACRAYQASVHSATVEPFARLTPLRPSAQAWQNIVGTIKPEAAEQPKPLLERLREWLEALRDLRPALKLAPAMALAGLLLVFGNLWLGKSRPSVPPTLIAMQRQLTPEQILFGSNPAIEAQILRGMRLDTPREKLFL